MALGHDLSRGDGRDRAHGGATEPYGRPQLAAAPADDRQHPPRPRLSRRPLHQQPESLRTASALYAAATNGGTLALQRAAPSTAAAEALAAQRLAAPPPADANDFIWQWEASRDYDPTSDLARIRCAVLAINSADDERNPPETGITAAAIAAIPRARLLLIPASAETAGHGTTGQARFWKESLRGFLAELG